MRLLPLSLVLGLAALGPAAAFDASKVPSPNYNRLGADRLTIQGAGSTAPSLTLTGPGLTGPVDGATVGGAALPSVLGSKAPLASPTFTGAVTAPSVTLTGSGLAGPVDSSTVAGTAIPAILAGKAPLASPSFTGTLTHTGLTFSLGGGAFINSTQPANAHVDLIAPNDRHHDNVLTIENKSIDPNNGNCGNAAIRFRAINGYEKGAIGYSRLGSDARCLTGFFPNTLYMEGGNLGPDGNSDDTDIAWVLTHVPGSKNFAGKQRRAFWLEASTGILRMVNSSGDNSAVFEPEAFRTTFRGIANHLRITGAASGSAPEIAAIGTPGSDFNVDLSLRSLGTGRILVNGTPLSAAATTAIGTSGAVLPLLSTANTWAGQQTLSAGLSVAGATSLSGNVNVAGGFLVKSPSYTFTTSGEASLGDNGSNGITIRVGPSTNYKYFFVNGDGTLNVPGTVTSAGYAVGANAGVSCSGTFTNNLQVINGIVTRC